MFDLFLPQHAPGFLYIWPPPEPSKHVNVNLLYVHD